MTVALRSWLAALGPPLVWFVHLLATYAVEEVVCSSNADRLVLGLSTVELLIAVITLAALAVVAVAGTTGYRLWRTRDRSEAGGPPSGSEAFLGLSGALLAVLFAAVILLEASPTLFLAPCM